VGSPPLLVTRTAAPAGLRLTGEIDESNVDQVAAALAEHRDGRRPLHLDVSEVTFCDVSGMRAVVSSARERPIVLHGIPAQLEKILNLTGWAEAPGLSFCGCKPEI